MPARPLSALELLERAQAKGLHVVQFCDNLPLTSLTAKELDQCCAFAAEHGIGIELGTRGASDSANLLSYLELAHRVGSPFVRLVVDANGDHPTPEETITRLRPIVARYADSKVQLALENHDRFPCRTLARIVEELGSDHVGICLDTVNSFGALEGPEMVIEMLAPYTLNLHIKDFTIERLASQMGFIVNGCAAGQGRLDVSWLFERLRTAGRDPDAIIELWTPSGPSLEETLARENLWAEQSVRYLRQFITQ
jgi:sugar phosphate isomerase/epimerase